MIPGAAMLALLVPLGLTIYAWQTSRDYTRQRNQALFSILADESEKILLHRIGAYTREMRGGLVNIQSSEQIKSRIWQRYVETIGLGDHSPWMKFFSFIQQVDPSKLDAFLEEARRERPDFDLHPKTSDRPYFIVRYIPPGGNPQAAGLNIAADDERLQAAELSRDTGELAITHRITLFQDKTGNPGFLVLMPLYRQGMPAATVKQRRAALLGWICWPLAARTFLSDLTSGDNHTYRLQVYDGADTAPGKLVYDSEPADGADQAPALSIRRPVRIMQRQWTLVWSSTPAFENNVHSVQSPLILASGVLFTTLFGIQLLFFRRRSQTVTALVKEKTRELAEREALYRLLAENTSDIISRVAFDGTRSYVSPACRALLGYEPEELAGQHFFDDFHCDHRLELIGLYRQFAKGELDQAVRVLSKRRKDGSWIKAEVTIKLVRDAQTQVPLETVVTSRDVTLREQKSEELELAKEEADDAKAKAEQANEAKTTFLASMSHEIRTPLNSIIGFTDILLSARADLSDMARRRLTLIQSAGATLLSIVNDILDFSRIEAGEIKIDPRPFSLDELIAKSTGIVRPLIDEKNLEFVVERNTDALAWYYGDDHRLLQILLNLLNNACKFTSGGSVRLVVDCTPDPSGGERLQFSVADTGPGIPTEKMELLFKRFSQLSDSTHRRFGGSGLGLAISKQLVELMGGTIAAYSTEGQGSMFQFEVVLPRSAPEVNVSGDAEQPAFPKGLRILLAEDLEINQEIAIATLAMHGHMVDVAVNGVEAVQALMNAQYDLVLMDMQMPVMDGLKATEQIRLLPEPASLVPIIAMTANVLPHQIERIKLAGANDHIGKPFDKADLFRKIARWTRSGAVAAAATGADTVDDRPGGPPSGDGDAADRAFKRDIFDDVMETLGGEKTELYIKTLRDLIESVEINRLEQDEHRDDLRRNAHKIVSTAGMLGFLQLSDAAIALEEACHRETDITCRLRQMLKAGAAAKRQMDELRAAA